MFISEEQLRERLASPRNLANRFRNGKMIPEEVRIVERAREEGHFNATSGISEVIETENPEIETKSSEELHKEGIQHREIKRPGNNRPWLSQQERTRISTEVATSSLDRNKTQTEIARQYGVQVSTVSDIFNNTRRIEGPRSVNQAEIDRALDKVREAAIDRLMSGLGQVTDDKIAAHNAKDISAICANMAKVVQQTIPQEKAAQQINLVVYTPELRAEKNFDSVEI